MAISLDLVILCDYLPFFGSLQVIVTLSDYDATIRALTGTLHLES